MTDSTGHKMVAPYLTAEKMMEPEGFRRHYETWRQFSVVKGADAPWLKRTMDPEVIEALEANHGTQFGSDKAQKKGESGEERWSNSASELSRITTPHSSKIAVGVEL